MKVKNMTRYMGDEDEKPSRAITLEDINRQASSRKVERDLQNGSKSSGIVENAESQNSTKIKKGKAKRKFKKAQEEVGENRDEVVEKKPKLEENEKESATQKKPKLSKSKKKRNKMNKISTDERTKIKLENDDFTVIGEYLDTKPQKVKRILPDWLANPEVISSNLHEDLTPIEALTELHQSILSLLGRNGITHLFPVQSTIIPWLLNNSDRSVYRPRDICVSSPTGSGKTLAYALPIIQAIRERMICSIRAIVVLPVRDLVPQVLKVFQTFCEGSDLKVGLAIGEKSFSVEQNQLIRKGYRRYHSLVDILICTPGRLVDHINETPGFSLQDLKYLVIDEADRMVQHIKQGWLVQVENCVNGKENLGNIPLTVSRLEQHRNIPQKLLFSATLSHNPEKLEQLKLFLPKLFTSIASRSDEPQQDADVSISDNYIGKYTTPQELTENYVICTPAIKPLILLHMIYDLKYSHILVFTNSINNTHRLFMLLNAYQDDSNSSIKIKELSSNLHIKKREKTLQQFAKGTVHVLVCSDSIARGIDVEDVKYVISYEKPPFLKTYIHRAGRTARAGRPGTAITFVQHHEAKEFKNMILTVKTSNLSEMTFSDEVLEPLESKFKNALKAVGSSLALNKSH